VGLPPMAASAGPILYDLAVLFVAAKLGGEAAERLRLPPVLGELVAGLLLAAGLLGGLLRLPDLSGHGGAGSEAEIAVIEALAAIGAILLLFEVGLETRIRDMRKVGLSSVLVAVIGIVLSFAIGFAASWGLAQAWGAWASAEAALPPYLLHVFVGAALTATSVGITARVLSDLGRLGTPEARIILGAAVLDDVGGLVILAVVAALATAAMSGDAVDTLGLLKIVGVAAAFLVLSIGLGLRVVPKAYDALTERFRVSFFPLVLAVAFALAMAYAASLAGLADIVGAFAGGLLLAETKHAHRLFEQLRPLAALFVGLFFVTLGMRVDVGQFADNVGPVLAIGLGLTILAIVGKLACGLGVVRRQADRLTVGVGMVPRGEVGLIFAGLGLATGLLANWQYAALLVMVFLTTLVTPLWLARRKDRFTPDLESPPVGERLAKATEL
jgi:Kef-type K+ transport system membrane component KefB